MTSPVAAWAANEAGENLDLYMFSPVGAPIASATTENDPETLSLPFLSAGEYIFVPVMMTFYAYERAVTDRSRKERAAREATTESSDQAPPREDG